MQPITPHASSGGDPSTAATQNRLPSFLLNSSGGGGGAGGFSSSGYKRLSGGANDMQGGGSGIAADPTWPFQAASRRSVGSSVAFNDRLRIDRGPNDAPTSLQSGSTAANPTYENDTPTRTPVRMPPNRSLIDSGSPSVLNLRTPSATPSGTAAATPGSFARTSARYSTPAGAASGLQSDAPGSDRCVTVFGFPPDLESQTLREFRRHGDILRTIPGRGNWVHLLYRTPLQAQIALYKPWRILAGTEVMVGVVPCTEPDVAKDINQSVERGVLIASPAVLRPNSTSNKDSSTPLVTSPTPARPGLPTPSSVLRREQGNAQTNLPSIVRTPQKQTGILDYITGFYK